MVALMASFSGVMSMGGIAIIIYRLESFKLLVLYYLLFLLLASAIGYDIYITWQVNSAPLWWPPAYNVSA